MSEQALLRAPTPSGPRFSRTGVFGVSQAVATVDKSELREIGLVDHSGDADREDRDDPRERTFERAERCCEQRVTEVSPNGENSNRPTLTPEAMTNTGETTPSLSRSSRRSWVRDHPVSAVLICAQVIHYSVLNTTALIRFNVVLQRLQCCISRGAGWAGNKWGRRGRKMRATVSPESLSESFA